MPAIPYIILAAGTGLQLIGQQRERNIQEAEIEYNAKIDKRNATEKEIALRERGRKLLARQKVLYAKANIDPASGSPLLQISNTAAEIERDALTIRQGGEEAVDYAKYRKKQIRKSGYLSTGATLLGSFGKGYNFYQSSK